jgi:hypothetical protein
MIWKRLFKICIWPTVLDKICSLFRQPGVEFQMSCVYNVSNMIVIIIKFMNFISNAKKIRNTLKKIRIQKHQPNTKKPAKTRTTDEKTLLNSQIHIN